MLLLELEGEGPLRIRLERALRAAIRERRLGSRAYLPSTRSLARQLGISRNTVSAAYEQLSVEGLVASRPRGGFRCVYGPEPAVSAPAVATPPDFSIVARSALQARAARPPGQVQPGSTLRWDLAYGSPWLNPALSVHWRRALGRAVERIAAGYPAVEGDPALREQIAAYLGRRRGLACQAQDILIVAGTQQAIELCARVLIRPGDLAVLEDPHYQGARIALACNGARVMHLPTDAQGLCVDRLPENGARLVCVTPSHQFPRGSVLSHARRCALVEWAQRHQAWVIEDDYDAEFRFDSRPMPSLKSLDSRACVIHAGTLSKVLWPGLRLGYLVAPPALREALLAVKWVSDRGCPALEQAALARLMEQGTFERHLRRATSVLAQRRAALLDALAAMLPGRVTVEGSDAGMHVVLWVHELEAARTPDLISAARVRGLGVYPIAPYFHEPPAQAGLLVGYAHLPPAQFPPAIAALADALDSLQAAR